METCTIEVNKDTLEQLSDVFQCGIHYEIKSVEVKDFDYSKYPEWVEQKKKSNKEYGKLKKIEYKLRWR